MAWDDIGPAMLGFGAQGPGGSSGAGGSGPVGSGLSSAVATAGGAAPAWYSPDNPLFWFGALLVAATGLITISTSAKAGPFKGKAVI